MHISAGRHLKGRQSGAAAICMNPPLPPPVYGAAGLPPSHSPASAQSTAVGAPHLGRCLHRTDRIGSLRFFWLQRTGEWISDRITSTTPLILKNFIWVFIDYVNYKTACLLFTDVHVWTRYQTYEVVFFFALAKYFNILCVMVNVDVIKWACVSIIGMIYTFF